MCKKKYLLFMLVIVFILSLSLPALAHPGEWDENGGHTDIETGEYHYHHGYPAHLHYDIDGDGIDDCFYTIDRTVKADNIVEEDSEPLAELSDVSPEQSSSHLNFASFLSFFDFDVDTEYLIVFFLIVCAVLLILLIVMMAISAHRYRKVMSAPPPQVDTPPQAPIIIQQPPEQEQKEAPTFDTIYADMSTSCIISEPSLTLLNYDMFNFVNARRYARIPLDVVTSSFNKKYNTHCLPNELKNAYHATLPSFFSLDNVFIPDTAIYISELLQLQYSWPEIAVYVNEEYCTNFGPCELRRLYYNHINYNYTRFALSGDSDEDDCVPF